MATWQHGKGGGLSSFFVFAFCPFFFLFLPIHTYTYIQFALLIFVMMSCLSWCNKQTKLIKTCSKKAEYSVCSRQSEQTGKRRLEEGCVCPIVCKSYLQLFSHGSLLFRKSLFEFFALLKEHRCKNLWMSGRQGKFYTLEKMRKRNKQWVQQTEKQNYSPFVAGLKVPEIAVPAKTIRTKFKFGKDFFFHDPCSEVHFL